MEPELFPNKPTPEEHLKKNKGQEQAYASVSKNVTALGSRLRVLEEQYSTIRNKSQLTERNLLDFEKDVRKDVKAISEEVLEIKSIIQELKEKIEIMSSELTNTVKEHDLRVIEKYVDLWNPATFITREALKERIEEMKK